MTTDRLFPGATTDQIRNAARACREAAAIADEEWDGDHATEARDRTEGLGWTWDFQDWSHAASILEQETAAECATLDAQGIEKCLRPAGHTGRHASPWGEF